MLIVHNATLSEIAVLMEEAHKMIIDSHLHTLMYL
jgi:hypothetical protein